MSAFVEAPRGVIHHSDPPEGDGRTGLWLPRALRRRGGNRWPDHWPFTALTMGFPVWWALGFMASALAFAIYSFRHRQL